MKRELFFIFCIRLTLYSTVHNVVYQLLAGNGQKVPWETFRKIIKGKPLVRHKIITKQLQAVFL